jgi:hypothetical protein
MTTDTIEAILNKENLEKIFPKERANDFFEALFGDADEGSYDIELAYRECNGDTLIIASPATLPKDFPRFFPATRLLISPALSVRSIYYWVTLLNAVTGALDLLSNTAGPYMLFQSQLRLKEVDVSTSFTQ